MKKNLYLSDTWDSVAYLELVLGGDWLMGGSSGDIGEEHVT